MEMGDTSGLKKYLAFCRRTREGGSRAREGLDQHAVADVRVTCGAICPHRF
jgi:hypothetical protein